MLSTFILFFRL